MILASSLHDKLRPTQNNHPDCDIYGGITRAPAGVRPETEMDKARGLAAALFDSALGEQQC